MFFNFNCVILDVVEVTIGDKTQTGPGVQILTADHPRDAAKRASGLEFGHPIRIGRNLWIGTLSKEMELAPNLSADYLSVKTTIVTEQTIETAGFFVISV